MYSFIAISSRYGQPRHLRRELVRERLQAPYGLEELVPYSTRLGEQIIYTSLFSHQFTVSVPPLGRQLRLDSRRT